MKLLVALLLIPSLSFAGSVSVDRVIRVYDGDTFYADINSYPPLIGKSMPIRIRGVDTPEIRGKCGREKALAREAKAFTESELSKGSAMLVDVERGTFFRLVATVLVEGEDLAEKLIVKGLGKPYSDPDRKEWCDE